MDGFLENPSLAVKTSTDLVGVPIDLIQVEGKDGNFTLKREEGTWFMTAPKRAAVEQIRVNAMLLPFQTPTESLFSKRVEEDELGLYGLGNQAIAINLFRGEQVFASFLVGDMVRSDDPEAATTEVDTWVQKPDTDQVYRMGGKDLRSPFAHSPSSIRSKNVFTFNREDIRSLTLHNPDNQAVPILKLKDQGGEAGGPGSWTIEVPTGFELGNINATLNSFVNLRATGFNPEGVTQESAGVRDEDAPFRAELGLADGTTVELRIGKAVEKDVAGMVVGSDELFTMADYTARSIRKGLDDVRNRKVLGLSPGVVDEVRFHASKTVLKRGMEGWKMPSHGALPLSQSHIQGFLEDVEGWTVTGFSPASEAEKRGLGADSNPEKVTIRHNGTDTVLLVGAAQDEVHWAMREGTDQEIWKVTSFMAEKIRGKSAEDFRVREIFSFGRDDLARVDLVHSNQTLVIERNPGGKDEETWKVTRGDDVVEKPKPQLVSSILSSIANIQAKGFADGTSRRAAGLNKPGSFHARILLADGTVHRLELSDDAVDKDPYAAAPSVGIWKDAVFTVNRFQADNIRKKFKDFVN